MPPTKSDDIRGRVLRAVDLPAIAPSVDRTPDSIARRAGLEVEEVEEALREMAAAEPPLVREVRGRHPTWVRLGSRRQQVRRAES